MKLKQPNKVLIFVESEVKNNIPTVIVIDNVTEYKLGLEFLHFKSESREVIIPTFQFLHFEIDK